MRRYVWPAILLIAVLGYVAQAEMTATTAMKDSTNYTSTGTDNYTVGQYPTTVKRTDAAMQIRNNYGSVRISMPFMRFDLSDIGYDNKLNDALLKVCISWSYKGVTRTYDIWGLNDTGSSTDPAGDMWDASTLTETYAVQTLGWYTIVASGGYYTSYSMNETLWTRLGSITFTVAANGSVIVTSNTTDMNMDAFFAADTNNLVTLALTPFYNSNNWHDLAASENTNSEYHPTLIFPHAYPRGSSNPAPADGAQIMNLDMSDFSWNTFDVGRYKLWLGPADANETNYKTLLGEEPIATIDVADADEEVNFTLPEGYLPLQAPKKYTWVLAGWIYDPNGLYSSEPDYVSAYQFQTLLLPVVTANPEPQYVFVGETATFIAQFDCAGTIDTFTWYKENGETDIAVDPEDTDVEITSNNGGTTYTCTLAISNIDLADDGEYYCVAENSSGSDTTDAVKLIVKRLLAQYKLEGNADDETSYNNGTLAGEPNFAAGIDGQAMEFTDNDYMVLPSGFARFDAGLTLSVWAKPTENSYYGRFFDIGNGQESDNILFFRAGGSGKAVFEVWNGATSVCYVMTADGVIVDNEWQHFVVTMSDAGSVVIYKNGMSVATGTGTLPVDVTRTSNFLGKSNWTATDEFYRGFMDDIRIFNYNIDADSVGYLYANIAGSYCQTSPTYDFDGNCKTDIGDLTIFAAEWLTDGYWPENPN